MNKNVSTAQFSPKINIKITMLKNSDSNNIYISVFVFTVNYTRIILSLCDIKSFFVFLS